MNKCLGDRAINRKACVKLSLCSILPEGRTGCTSHPALGSAPAYFLEASKLADESLKAEIEKEIKKAIWVIHGLASWKASKSKKGASPW